MSNFTQRTGDLFTFNVSPFTSQSAKRNEKFYIAYKIYGSKLRLFPGLEKGVGNVLSISEHILLL